MYVYIIINLHGMPFYRPDLTILDGCKFKKWQGKYESSGKGANGRHIAEEDHLQGKHVKKDLKAHYP